MKKTLLILAVLFATVSNNFAETEYPDIPWTGSYGWMTVDANSLNNYSEFKNIQVNINSTLGALELCGYGNRGTSGQVWIECYAPSASYYYAFHLGSSDPSHKSLSDLFKDWNYPLYFGTLYVDMSASGPAEGRLYVNWAAI